MGKSVKMISSIPDWLNTMPEKNKMRLIIIEKVEAKPMDVLVLRTSFFMVYKELHKHRII